MVSPNELYNLRWNCYVTNLLNSFNDHENNEYLTDLTIGAEGQLIKAHKLILAASSCYFQAHPAGPLTILLNDVKFDHLKMIIQFMYKGEVKVAHSEMQQLLQLGRMLQVKGLSSVEFANKNISKKETVKVAPKVDAVPKKRKLSLETEPKLVAIVKKTQTPIEKESTAPVLRPPTAFMIFANQWRKKLEVEYPNESIKEISVRLSNMWKSLSAETKEAFYEDARVAERNYTRTLNKSDEGTEDPDCILYTEPEFIDVKVKDEKPEDSCLD